MSHRLAKTGFKFRMPISKVNGSKFYGQLLDIPDTSRVSNFLTTRRYLRTPPITSVIPGDVIIVNGVKYIVAEHGDGFYKTVIYKHFKLFQVDRELNWTRKTYTENPITGIMEKNLSPQADVVYISMQPKSNTEDSINIPQQTHIAICPIEIERGETIDNFIVTKIDMVLGVYLLELKEI